jgi:predicted nucleotidyltransferase
MWYEGGRVVIMRDTIFARLSRFEKENNVEIILAVESGSRGWGFASTDSDYDVRFVYKHPIERYLDLNKPQDCHTWIEGECDYEGFDIYKFYDLLGKSNMNIIDWVQQDVIYIDRIKYKETLKMLIKEGFNRRTYAAHNFGLAQKNYSKYFASPSPDEPTIKRFVYCIRALLSAQYCMFMNELAPIKFDDLLVEMLKGNDLIEMRAMVEEKKATKEKKPYTNAKWKTYIEQHLKDRIVSLQTDHNTFDAYQSTLNTHLKIQLGIPKADMGFALKCWKEEGVI